MYPGVGWIRLVVLSLRLHPLYAGGRLSEHIRSYQPLFYDAEQLNHQHQRAKRASPPVISFDFEAFGRTFNLTLQANSRLLSPAITLETTRGYVDYDVGRVYTGHHRGQDVESPPSVRGVISSTGHFEGSISSPPHLFLVEQAHKHFTYQTDFHSVIYKASDIEFDIEKSLCASTIHSVNLINLQKKIKREQTNESPLTDVSRSDKKPDWFKHEEKAYWRGRHNKSEARARRSVPSRRTCELYVQADHLYLSHLGGHVESVIQQLANTVHTLNSIYSPIDFDGDGVSDDINFVIRRLKVHTDPEDISYRLNGHFGVEKFLELHSTGNYSQYCLSYIFTHRDFDGGTLGLAWTAGNDQAGGLCETYTTYSQGSLTLNTGVVTSLNYGKTVPSHVTALTLAHEIGHNFGAQHDAEGGTCSPGGTEGNYIMYARATDGYLPNNDKFSPCSIAAMAPFVLARGLGPGGCFVESVTSLCGNRVVEEGEACDCGYEEDCQESCCTPQTHTPGASTPCNVRVTSVCSPSSGPCCDSTCQYITSASSTACHANTSCLQPAFCTQCPTSVWKPDGTPCEDQRVCINGTCSGSACLQKELEPCQCAPSASGDWQDVKLCSICCLVDGQCKPSYEIAGLPNGSTPAGSPCHDFRGYCDVFYRCREVDPSGTFSTLRKLLSPESLESIKQWITLHWYVPVLALITLIILMVLFVKVCGRRVPSDRELYERKRRNHGNRDVPLRHRSNKTSVAPTGYM